MNNYDLPYSSVLKLNFLIFSGWDLKRKVLDRNEVLLELQILTFLPPRNSKGGHALYLRAMTSFIAHKEWLCLLKLPC